MPISPEQEKPKMADEIAPEEIVARRRRHDRLVGPRRSSAVSRRFMDGVSKGCIDGCADGELTDANQRGSRDSSIESRISLN